MTPNVKTVQGTIETENLTTEIDPLGTLLLTFEGVNENLKSKEMSSCMKNKNTKYTSQEPAQKLISSSSQLNVIYVLFKLVPAGSILSALKRKYQK